MLYNDIFMQEAYGKTFRSGISWEREPTIPPRSKFFVEKYSFTMATENYADEYLERR